MYKYICIFVITNHFIGWTLYRVVAILLERIYIFNVIDSFNVTKYKIQYCFTF